ncbi:MAG: CotH kinase family protein [Ruminiclostridium sp.]
MCKLLKTVKAFLIIFTVVLVVCFNQINVQAADVQHPAGWTEETHGKVDGNYSMVFPDDKVQRIDIIISPENYRTMETDLNGMSMPSTRDPVYVPATVKFNDITWWYVGIRYKGESTLFTPKMSGKHKFPFRLNFDKFEDQYPEIKNQKFFGFKELAFSNNWFDPSFVRDKVFSDMLRDGGIPAVHCAFSRVYIDTGSGPVYWGLYTLAEDPADEMLKNQFQNSKGNLYKGQTGVGGDLTTFNQQGFEKKTNEDANDWSDIQALVKALNAPRTNAASWRAGLESVFNVNGFLRWLAINTAAVNIDTYGWVTKNNYLYQDLSKGGRITYLPCDFNMSLNNNPFGMTIPGIPASLSLNEIGNNWPLIRFLINDPVYKNIYHNEMQTAINGCFNQTAITARIRQLHEMVSPYVVGAERETSNYSFLTNGATQFNRALTDLVNHVSSRHTAVNSYLSTVTITPITKKGDISGDSQIDAIDYVLLQKHLLNVSILSGDALIAADVDSNGSVDTMDLVMMKKYLMGLISDF